MYAESRGGAEREQAGGVTEGREQTSEPGRAAGEAAGRAVREANGDETIFDVASMEVYGLLSFGDFKVLYTLYICTYTCLPYP